MAVGRAVATSVIDDCQGRQSPWSMVPGSGSLTDLDERPWTVAQHLDDHGFMGDRP